MRIGMHIRYYVFKPCKGHLKVDCLYGTGLVRVNRTAQKWTSYDILSPPLLLWLFWQISLIG